MSVLKTMHKQPTYNELIRDISNPNKIKLPNRDATIIRRSNMLTQFDDNMDNVDEEYKKLQLKKINEIKYRDSYASHVGYIPSAIKPKPYKDIAPDEPDEEIQARMDRQALRDQQMIDSVPVPGPPQIFGISSAASASAAGPTTRAPQSVVSSLQDIEDAAESVEEVERISPEQLEIVDNFDFEKYERYRAYPALGHLTEDARDTITVLTNILIQAIRENLLSDTDRIVFMRYLNLKHNTDPSDLPDAPRVAKELFKKKLNALAYDMRKRIDQNYGAPLTIDV